jgi:hypothetical protein
MKMKKTFTVEFTEEERSELSHVVYVMRRNLIQNYESNILFIDQSDPEVKRFLKGLNILGQIEDKLRIPIKI